MSSCSTAPSLCQPSLGADLYHLISVACCLPRACTASWLERRWKERANIPIAMERERERITEESSRCWISSMSKTSALHSSSTAMLNLSASYLHRQHFDVQEIGELMASEVGVWKLLGDKNDQSKRWKQNQLMTHYISTGKKMKKDPQIVPQHWSNKNQAMELRCRSTVKCSIQWGDPAAGLSHVQNRHLGLSVVMSFCRTLSLCGPKFVTSNWILYLYVFIKADPYHATSTTPNFGKLM